MFGGVFIRESTYLLMEKIRGGDLVMKSCLNGRERGIDQWKELFKESDERFRFRGVKRIPGSRFSVIEVAWEEHSVGV